MAQAKHAEFSRRAMSASTFNSLTLSRFLLSTFLAIVFALLLAACNDPGDDDSPIGDDDTSTSGDDDTAAGDDDTSISGDDDTSVSGDDDTHVGDDDTSISGDDDTSVSGDDDTTTGDDDTAAGDDDTHVGDDDTSTGDDDTHAGDDDTSTGDDDTAVSGDDDTHAGDDDTSTGDDDTAVSGDDDTSTGDDDTHVGDDDTSTGDDDTAVSGDDDTSTGDDDTHVGDDDTQPGDDDTSAGDADGDGQTVSEGDCDDNDPTVFDGAEEICDDKDNNCDGTVDEGVTSTFYADNDGDGHGDVNTPIEACCTAAPVWLDGEITGYALACPIPEGYAESDDDCDDGNAARYPGNPEACDGIDNDCDGLIDEDLLDTVYLDADGDGFGTSDVSMAECSIPEGYSAYDGDCDDSDPEVYPDNPEVCDNKDNDCNGEIDDGVLHTYYVDADYDGYGNSDASIEACSIPDAYSEVGGDCNDGDGDIYPGNPEVCDSKDNDCNGEVDDSITLTYYLDADGDDYGSSDSQTESCETLEGYSELGGDCNDGDADIFPGNPEVCDDKDNDCNGQVDDGVLIPYYLDADHDGYGNSDTSIEACALPDAYSEVGGDCNDEDADIYPGNPEVCDDKDNDCNGQVDDGVLSTYYVDADHDGYGNSDASLEACSLPDAYSEVDGDCNDEDADMYPGNPEVCDNKDNDCNGDVDDGVLTTYYLDFDFDGYGDSSSNIAACSLPEGYAESDGDCNDQDADIYPGNPEVCDEKDNDCNGQVDDGVQRTFYLDADGDEHGVELETVDACSAPEGYASSNDDCNDADADIHPDHDEVCDGKDNDCDGVVDGPVPVDGYDYYLDLDGDGYGDPAEHVVSCEMPEDTVDNPLDCDDQDPDTVPGISTCPWPTGGAVNCLAALENDPAAEDGYYEIDPNGDEPFAAYCDMTWQGGGWTLVGRLQAGDWTKESIYRDERFFHSAWQQYDTSYELGLNEDVILGNADYGMLDATALFDYAGEVRFACEDYSRSLYADAIWQPTDSEVTEFLETVTYSDVPKSVRFAKNTDTYELVNVYPTADVDSTWGCWHICGGCAHIDDFEWSWQLGLCHNSPGENDSSLSNINQIAIGFHDGYNGLRLECTADTPTSSDIIDGVWEAWTR